VISRRHSAHSRKRQNRVRWLLDRISRRIRTLASAAPRATKRPTAKSSPAKSSPTEQLRETIVTSLDDDKALDIITIPLEGRSSIADVMVVASGRSDRHVNALSEKLVSRLKDAGFGNPRVEGAKTCDWVLIDTGDAIIHIFRPEVREFYNIEKMWGVELPGRHSAES
jgi:ribosome-associated protein